MHTTTCRLIWLSMCGKELHKDVIPLTVLAIIGAIVVVFFGMILGIDVLAIHDSELLKMHPPDDDHEIFPEGDDDV